VSHLLPYLPPSVGQALAGYPSWLVIAVALVAALLMLWILGKLLKWALYLLLIVLSAGIVGVVLWLIWQAVYGAPGAAHG
jgi:hypothetical protein